MRKTRAAVVLFLLVATCPCVLPTAARRASSTEAAPATARLKQPESTRRSDSSAHQLDDDAEWAPYSNRRLLQQPAAGPQGAASSQWGNSTAAASIAAAAGEESVWVQSLEQHPPAWATSDLLVQAQDDNCPGCVSGYCFNTDQGYRCTSCLGSLFVSRSDGTCGCPSGRYSPSDAPATCKDCEKSFFCLGGKYTGVAGTPPRTACSVFGDGLTTLGLRSINKKLCVNLPGYSYSVDATSGDPSATPCPSDTYGPGLRKQRACPPCPGGYSTFGKTKQTSMAACVVQAGYFQVSPGRVAPCPRGTYKPTLDPLVNCTKCAGEGVTTRGEASTSVRNCSDVSAGVYATSVVDGVVIATAKCPQRYYCPGGTATQAIDPTNVPAGDPTIIKCPRGSWTQGLGSTVESLCLTPPGHFTSATDTQPCSDGQYRPGWVAPDSAASCLKCSPDNSISSMPTEVMTAFKPDGTELSTMVKATTLSCYIVGGQGLVVDNATNTFRAQNCDKNNWGVSDNSFGLNPNWVCKDCPANLVTSKDPTTNPISSGYYKQDKTNPSKGGFTAGEACVTRPGWGVVKGVAMPCDQGSWSPGDTLDVCISCGYGLTTAPNSTQSDENSCVIAPGYGFLRRAVVPCPKGTYNDQIRKDNSTPCTPCPGGSTNNIEGATSKDSCNMCNAGYGGDKCDVCGGDNPTYGPGGPDGTRAIGQPCVDCPPVGGVDGGGGVGGFGFTTPDGKSDFFTPRVIAAIAATQPTDCVGEYTQIADAAWNLEPQLDADWGGTAVSVEMHADCVQLCSYDTACQFVQFDYSKTDNNCRLKVQTSAAGSDILAFKAVPSTDLGAASARITRVNGSVRAKAVVSSGKYTFWRDPSASRIGRQADPPQGAPLNYNSCLLSCDEDNECAGVFMTLQALNLKPLACKLIYGDKTPGVFKRTLTRMIADADHMDMYTLMGPA